MADMGMYHALDPSDPNNNPNGHQQPPPNAYRPPVAPPPNGYFQGNNGPMGVPPNQPYAMNPYGAPPGPSQYTQIPSGAAAPVSAYGPPQPSAAPFGSMTDVNSLAQGMSGMDLAGQPQPHPSRNKKKQRAHAYHDLNQAPGAGAPMPGFAPNVGDNLQQGFLGQHAPAAAPGHAGSQFPMAAAPQFAPAAPADPAAFNARRPVEDTGVFTSSGARVDQDAIPSVPAAREHSAQFFNEHVYHTDTTVAPPNATADYIAFDRNNASTKFARLTVRAVPATAELLNNTHLPLGLVLQPLAKLRREEEEVPVLDFGDAGPPRCRRCRTYINPFMQFLEGGGKFRCNMCMFPNNDVPPEYYAPVDMHGVRVDREQRPELTRGTVEFVVPKEYWAKKDGDGKGGFHMRYLFLLDVTEAAVNRGMLDAVVMGVKDALFGDGAYTDALADEETHDGKEGKKRRLPHGCKIGIATFDKELHFYNLSPSLDAAQMIVMSDIEDPFVPIHDGLFVDPFESRSQIEGLLDSLPHMFAAIKSPEPALMPALKAALSALEKTGGKIICSLSTIPTWGPDRLVLREDTKLYGTEKEKTLFKTDAPAWRNIAGQMVQAGVGIDFFLAPTAYIDVATIGHVSATTGGELYYYPNFVHERDVGKLSDEIVHTVHRQTGSQALMKVRCSTGLQVTSYHGNFLQMGSSTADVEFGTIDEDKALCVMFSHDGKLDPKVDAHFQSALLYTTKTGERRVRCSNIVAAVTESEREAIRLADQDAVIGILAREGAAKMLEKPVKEVRESLTEKCVHILAAYRRVSGTNSPPTQLILPESLREFAMFVLALIKCRAFRAGNNISSDIRVHAMRMLKHMSLKELSLYLYPRIFGLHDMSDSDCFPILTGHLQLPRALRASFQFLPEGGVYLVDNGQSLLLWVHATTSPQLLQDLFGVDNIRAINPLTTNPIPVLDTVVNAQVRNLIRWIGAQRGSKKVLVQMARQGLDGAEYDFAHSLVEDRNHDERAYVDWLVHLHKYIQLEITGRKADAAKGAVAGSYEGMRPGYW